MNTAVMKDLVRFESARSISSFDKKLGFYFVGITIVNLRCDRGGNENVAFEFKQLSIRDFFSILVLLNSALPAGVAVCQFGDRQSLGIVDAPNRIGDVQMRDVVVVRERVLAAALGHARRAVGRAARA